MAEGGAIEVVVIRIDTDPDTVGTSDAMLSPEERQRAGRFAFDRDRCRFTVARAWLRQLLGMRLGVRPGSVEFAYGQRGKPALTGALAHSGLQFNVSHCDDVAVYAFSPAREIGVDIETVRVIPGADEIAAHAFSPRENAAYLALAPHDRPLGFFNCWTRKEAFVKALGDGLSHRLDRFDVSLAPGRSARILRVDSTPGDRCGWALHGFVPGPGLTGALVVKRVHNPVADPERITLRSCAAAI